MKIGLLKRIRKESWNKYEIRDWSDVAGCYDKPWHICVSEHQALGYHEYKTKQEAIEATKLLWHEEAEKYLWKHREKRQRNKYPW